MSKPFKPPRPKVALRPSRIRRDPVPVHVTAERKVRTSSRELELWGGVAGVLLFAAAIATVIVGIGVATGYLRIDDTAAARAGQFGHCYNEGGPNCVLDGDTLYVAGEKVQIARIEAPQIQDARCDAERSRGIDAAVRLVDLLNRGKVSVSPTFRDAYGRDVRIVAVNGRDVGERMINGGVVREYGSGRSWC